MALQYGHTVRPECLTPDGYGPAVYLAAVRERHRRLSLAALHTGVHWGEEERDRLRGVERMPAAERHCQHFTQRRLPGTAEDTAHIIGHCSLYTDPRPLFPELFPPGQEPKLAMFLAGPPEQQACFAGACRRRAHKCLGRPL